MSESLDAQRYKKGDHAKTHRRLKPGPERNTVEVEQDFEKLMRDGYVIIEKLIPLETCTAIKEEGLALLGQTGRNPFEGHQTQRVYNVLSKTRATDQLAVHQRILGLMDRLFEPGFLLSQSQIINILPGEAPQGLHHDDAFYRLPAPVSHWAPQPYGRLMTSTKIMALPSSCLRVTHGETIGTQNEPKPCPPFMGMVEGMHPLRLLEE